MTTLQDVEEVNRRIAPLWIDPAYAVLDGRPMLTAEHCGGLEAEYGAEAVVRYYSPDDPRL